MLTKSVEALFSTNSINDSFLSHSVQNGKQQSQVGYSSLVVTCLTTSLRSKIQDRFPLWAVKGIFAANYCKLHSPLTAQPIVCLGLYVTFTNRALTLTA